MKPIILTLITLLFEIIIPSSALDIIVDNSISADSRNTVKNLATATKKLLNAAQTGLQEPINTITFLSNTIGVRQNFSGFRISGTTGGITFRYQDCSGLPPTSKTDCNALPQIWPAGNYLSFNVSGLDFIIFENVNIILSNYTGSSTSGPYRLSKLKNDPKQCLLD